eukprot:TRINITY_DN48583_c0_g1_i1.p1 TRINITY_DN48583_c0_g1~~TRINITY_DN48583_c0_g1_i1.p1  ORF type:complete len:138 (+),score=20.84 TRINITY_DN48583_c0_g1_i1:361-774(+)
MSGTASNTDDKDAVLGDELDKTPASHTDKAVLGCSGATTPEDAFLSFLLVARLSFFFPRLLLDSFFLLQLLSGVRLLPSLLVLPKLPATGTSAQTTGAFLKRAAADTLTTITAPLATSRTLKANHDSDSKHDNVKEL